MIITIYNNRQSVDIDRYDKPHDFKGKQCRRYLKPSRASIARLYRVVQELKAYHTDSPPHWTSYTLIKDPTRRNHFAMLHQSHKRIGQPWEIDENIYWEFLGMLPPLDYKNGSFYMSEFYSGNLTTRYSRQGNRYFCEFAIYPPQKEASR